MGNRISILHSSKLNKSGQATTELAIFGFVMLIALASLLRYGQIMNQQQEMRMHAFRKALNKATKIRAISPTCKPLIARI